MMYWIIHISLLGFLSYVAFKHLKSSFNPCIYWSALTLKLVAGIGVGLIFHYYYGFGDSLTLFEMSVALSELSITDHFKELIADGSYASTNHPRDLFFVKVLSVISRITGSSYWITSLYLSCVSFYACWFFVITIPKIFPAIKKNGEICFLFIPTIIFWSSGILKDTLSSTALIFSIAILLKAVYLKKYSILEIVLGLISLLVLFKIKHYLFISFILFSGLFLGIHLLRTLKKKSKWIIIIGIIATSITSTQYVHPYLKWDRIPQTILEINETITENSRQRDHSMITINEPTWIAVANATPKALFAGLFRPSIFDSTISFGLVHRIENFVLLILSVFSILLCFRKGWQIDVPLIVSALACISLLAAMLALTTPNFGTLVRYRNAFLPFLFLIVSILPFQYITSKTEE